MDRNPIFDRNLLGLSSMDTHISKQITTVNPSGQVEIEQSKNGYPVPCIKSGDYIKALHSRFNPIKEGDRFSMRYPGEGFFVFLGLGGGYHIAPFLKRKGISHILVIDENIEYLRAILEKIDMNHIILDTRVNFLIDATPEEIETYILSHYIPAITGDMKTVSLRPRIELNESYFQQTMKTIKEVIDQLADDYTVQSYFGKQWYINTVANLSRAETSSVVFGPRKEISITAAGPSLETQIPSIKKHKQHSFLIATDTSLPTLLSFDILPDAVISIDCQQITYHHFLQGYPKSVPLVLDLASPPLLTEFTDKLLFFSSGHPFSQYVNNHWREFPFIDTSGGNVAHAVISFANSLGAHRIYLYGADFSYPKGKSYSRGTYLYPFFRSLESRFSPLEHHFFTFLLRNENMTKTPQGDTFRYTTKPMISYKERLEKASQHIEANIMPMVGEGEVINVAEKPKIRENPFRHSTIFAAGPAASGWKEFLTQYDYQLSELPQPQKAISSYFNRLSQHQMALWTTLFPAAAAFRKEKGDTSSIKSYELLRWVRSWSRTVIKKHLSGE